MKIAIWGINSSKKYTGGRLHAWFIAEALSHSGHEVEYFTNNIPAFYNEFQHYPKHNLIKINVNSFFIFNIRKKFDIIFVIPHVLTPKSYLIDRFIFFKSIESQKKINTSKLIYLDFESPNWVNEVVPNTRPYKKYKYCDQIIKKSDIILSTTKTGKDYASKYYSKFNKHLVYEQLYLCINDSIAKKYISSYKLNRAVFFGRFSEIHKNSNSVLNIIKSLPKDFIFAIIINQQQLSQEIVNSMENVAKENNIKIELYFKINDEQKFKLLSESKLLLFSSNFEGFGIPPVEAQYVNTPVICSDLPVLREVNSLGSFVDFSNLLDLKRTIECVLNTQYSKNQLHESITEIAEFKSFASKLNYIIKNI
jgi:glycosyltransferase involved in cell wall biosynthesis